jgi:hypothetical protein
MTAFWNVPQRGLAEAEQRVKGAYRIHHHGDPLMMEAVRTSKISPEGCRIQMQPLMTRCLKLIGFMQAENTRLDMSQSHLDNSPSSI